MRSASIGACLLLGLLVTPAWSQSKPDKGDKAEKSDKTEPAEKRVPAIKADTEIDGKTFIQWASYLENPEKQDPSNLEKAVVVLPGYGDLAKPYAVKIAHVAQNPKIDLAARVKAISALGVMKLEDRDTSIVAGALANILDNEPQHSAQLYAAMALTRFDNKAWPQTQRALLGGTQARGSWQIRKASIVALRRIGFNPERGPEPKAIDYVVQTARYDSARQVRIEAVQALGVMGPPADVKSRENMIEALKKLANDNDKVVAIWAQSNLIHFKIVKEDGLKQIEKYLDAKEVEVCGQGLLALGALGEKAKPSIGKIIEMLKLKNGESWKDKNGDLVVATIVALSSIGDKDAVVLATLDDLSKNKDAGEHIRLLAGEAVKALTTDKKETRPPAEIAPKNAKP